MYLPKWAKKKKPWAAACVPPTGRRRQTDTMIILRNGRHKQFPFKAAQIK